MMRLLKYALPVILILISFMSGVFWSKRHCEKAFDSLRGGKFHHKMVKRLHNKLDLTENQKAEVKAILEDQKVKLDLLRDELHPKFHDIRRETHNRIRLLLDKEQLGKFEKIIERRDKRKRARGEKRAKGHKRFDDSLTR